MDNEPHKQNNTNTDTNNHPPTLITDQNTIENIKTNNPQTLQQTKQIQPIDTHPDQNIVQLEPPQPESKETQLLQFKNQTPMHPYDQQAPKSIEPQRQIISGENRYHIISNAERPAQAEIIHPPFQYHNIAPEAQDIHNENRVNPEWVSLPNQDNPFHEIHEDPNASIRPQRSQRSNFPMWVRVLILLGAFGLAFGLIYLCMFRNRKSRVAESQTIIIPKSFVGPRNMVEAIPENEMKTLLNIPERINPQTKSITKQTKVQTSERTKSDDIKISNDSIILKRGSRTWCPYNQLLLNGNCLACEEGEQWMGLQCIPIIGRYRHMRRTYY